LFQQPIEVPHLLILVAAQRLAILGIGEAARRGRGGLAGFWTISGILGSPHLANRESGGVGARHCAASLWDSELGLPLRR
jgi:hypothetical protein